jgi:cell division control protein 6
MYSLFGHSTKKKTKVVHINCMTLQDPRRIFNILLEKGFEKQCSSSAYEKDHRYALSHLRKAVSTASKAPKRGPGEMVIIVLDEIDHLFQNQGNVLYDLFSLAEIQSSNVVLIGIANSIDMTLRMLPHLHTIGVQPAMVNFRAYVHSELLSLMQERLHSLEGPVFGEKAIELCSRKIAAELGDMRQCLNAAYAAMEIHISHMKASETSQDGASAPSSGIKKFVDLQHMSLALGKCLKLPLINGMRALPQHQQMILCSHALMKTEGEVLLTSLFSKYSELCKSTKICRLAFNEFENACTSLHDQGLVALNKKANLHSKALKLKVKMSDIVFALQGIRFFHTILNSDK